jgi:hypothetical protein
MCRLQWRYENQEKTIGRGDIREMEQQSRPQVSIGTARKEVANIAASVGQGCK